MMKMMFGFFSSANAGIAKPINPPRHAMKRNMTAPSVVMPAVSVGVQGKLSREVFANRRAGRLGERGREPPDAKDNQGAHAPRSPKELRHRRAVIVDAACDPREQNNAAQNAEDDQDTADGNAIVGW